MSPLQNTHVVHPGLAAAVQTTVQKSLPDPGTIYRVTAGPPPFPKPEGWTGRTTVYTGNFRVTQLNREGGGTPGEQPTQERAYMVTGLTDIPLLQAGERGDIIAVAGREYRVRQVLFGSQLWELDIICTDNLTQQNPV